MHGTREARKDKVVIFLGDTLFDSWTTARRFAEEHPRIDALVASPVHEVIEALLDSSADVKFVTHLMQGLVPVEDQDGQLIQKIAKDPRLRPFVRSPYEGLLYFMLEARSETRGRFQTNQRIVGQSGDSFEVDLVDFNRRLIIEVDGGQHESVEQKYRDERKEAELRSRGFEFIRTSHSGVAKGSSWRLATCPADLRNPRQEREQLVKPLEPRKDRLHRIDSAQFVATYLTKVRGAVSTSIVNRQLAPNLEEKAILQCLHILEAEGKCSRQDGRIRIEGKAAASTRAILGEDSKAPWTKIRDGRFVLMALGFEPDDQTARRRKGKADSLRALVIATTYGLELPSEQLTPRGVRAELVTRVLRQHMADIVGRDPLPIEKRATGLERVILGGLAGVRARNFKEAWSALAATSIGLEDKSIESLRVGVIRGALRAPTTNSNAVVQPSKKANSDFPERVLAVARRVAEDDRRFSGRVSIAAVYEAYGRGHPDAGRIAEFKQRLVEAARRKELSLERLDLPELLTSDERSRSAAAWDDDHRHLIVTGG